MKAVCFALLPFLAAETDWKTSAIVTLCVGPGRMLYSAHLVSQLRSIKTQAKVVILTDEKTNNKEAEGLALLRELGADVEVIPDTFSERIQTNYEQNSHQKERDSVLLKKMYCWEMTKYKRILLLDSDVVIMDPFDEIFSVLEQNKAHCNEDTHEIEPDRPKSEKTVLFSSTRKMPEVAGVPMSDVNEKIVFFSPCSSPETGDIETCFADMQPFVKGPQHVNKTGANLGVFLLRPNRNTLEEMLRVFGQMKQRTCCPLQEFVYRFFEARGSYLRLPQIYNTRRIEMYPRLDLHAAERNTKIFHFVESDKLGFLQRNDNVFSRRWNEKTEELDRLFAKMNPEKHKAAERRMKDFFVFESEKKRLRLY
ncbi:MAG: glycosyl transferase [Amphiamblys sp. WSBS2006]|nr:MAG: glycosyl transferase [Amphiamblys sp. WSBS2006]